MVCHNWPLWSKIVLGVAIPLAIYGICRLLHESEAEVKKLSPKTKREYFANMGNTPPQ